MTDGNAFNKRTFRDSCPNTPPPPTPPVVRKFSRYPVPGAVIPRGRAGDPDVASNLVHGIRNDPITSAHLLNPPRKTFFQQRLEDISESVYRSSQQAPLGRSRLPSRDDKTVYGTKTVNGVSMRELINSSTPVAEVEMKVHNQIYEPYIRSHNSDSVGEQIDKNWDLIGKSTRFGISTPHFNDGRNIAKTFQWLGEKTFYNPNAVWKRSGNKEMLALQLGMKNDNMKRTRGNFPTEQIFGVPCLPDKHGVAELLHHTEPGEFVRDRDPQRSLVNAVRHQLKTLNFSNFNSLLQAFLHYDKKGRGLIDKEDLWAVCRQFQLGVSEQVLDDLIKYCDTDEDGLINFKEFVNFLNWKDLLPLNNQEQRMLTNGHLTSSASDNIEKKPLSETAQPPVRQALIIPEDLEDADLTGSLKTDRTLVKQKPIPDHFRTSSSVIGLSDGSFTSDSHIYGIPSVRTNLPGPHIKRLSDTTNYGETSTAYDLLHPSTYARHGVYDEQLFCPRTKKEIAEIFRNVGVDLSEETFEEAWNLTSMKHPTGEVCVEAFSNILKEMKAL